MKTTKVEQFSNCMIEKIEAVINGMKKDGKTNFETLGAVLAVISGLTMSNDEDCEIIFKQLSSHLSQICENGYMLFNN